MLFPIMSLEELRVKIVEAEQSLRRTQLMCELLETAQMDIRDMADLHEQTLNGLEAVYESLMSIQELTETLLIHLGDNANTGNSVGTLWISSESSSSSSASERSNSPSPSLNVELDKIWPNDDDEKDDKIDDDHVDDEGDEKIDDDDENDDKIDDDDENDDKIDDDDENDDKIDDDDENDDKIDDDDENDDKIDDDDENDDKIDDDDDDNIDDDDENDDNIDDDDYNDDDDSLVILYRRICDSLPNDMEDSDVSSETRGR